MTDKKKQNAEARAATRDLGDHGSQREGLAQIGDRFEYEQQLNSLPTGDRDLAEEVTRLADLCRYFSENEMQVPPHICREVGQLPKLAVEQRAERMREINLELMEYLHSVSEDSELRM